MQPLLSCHSLLSQLVVTAMSAVLRSNPSEPVAPLVGSARLVPVLLQAGADTCVSDADGNFPLHWVLSGVSLPSFFGTMQLELVSNSR